MRLASLFRLMTVGLLFAIGLLATYFIYDRWHAYHRSDNNLQDLVMLQLSLAAMERISAERGPLNAGMGAMEEEIEPDSNKLVISRHRTDESLDALLSTLKARRTPSTIVIEHDLHILQRELALARKDADKVLLLPQPQRSSADIEQVIARMASLNKRLVRAAAILEQQVIRNNGECMINVQNARIAAALREQTGLLGSQLMPAISTGRPLRQSEIIHAHRIRERIDQLHLTLNQQLNTLSPSQIRFWQEKKQMEDNYFKQALPLIDGLLQKGEVSGNYGITAREFTDQYVPNLQAIQQLRRILLEDTIEKIDRTHTGNGILLCIAIAASALAMNFVLFILRQIRNRMILPIIEAGDVLKAPLKDLYKRTRSPLYQTQDEASEMLLSLYASRLREATQRRYPRDDHTTTTISRSAPAPSPHDPP